MNSPILLAFAALVACSADAAVLPFGGTWGNGFFGGPLPLDTGVLAGTGFNGVNALPAATVSALPTATVNLAPSAPVVTSMPGLRCVCTRVPDARASSVKIVRPGVFGPVFGGPLGFGF